MPKHNKHNNNYIEQVCITASLNSSAACLMKFFLWYCELLHYVKLWIFVVRSCLSAAKSFIPETQPQRPNVAGQSDTAAVYKILCYLLAKGVV